MGFKVRVSIHHDWLSADIMADLLKTHWKQLSWTGIRLLAGIP